MNLVLNASDALGETGGVITVTTSAGRGSQVSALNPANGLREGTTSSLRSRITVPG
jgi:hypothetical protein